MWTDTATIASAFNGNRATKRRPIGLGFAVVTLFVPKQFTVGRFPVSIESAPASSCVETSTRKSLCENAKGNVPDVRFTRTR